MTFDLICISSHWGVPASTSRNIPAGAGDMAHPRHLPMTPDQIAIVQALLEEVRAEEAEGPDQLSCYTIDFSDGGTADVHAGDSGVMISIDLGITLLLVDFVFRLLREGRMVTFTSNTPVLIGVGQASFKDIPHYMPRHVASTREELGLLLNRYFEYWRLFPDRSVHQLEDD